MVMEKGQLPLSATQLPAESAPTGIQSILHGQEFRKREQNFGIFFECNMTMWSYIIHWTLLTVHATQEISLCYALNSESAYARGIIITLL